MAYGNNDADFEGGAPKKADVLIRSTQRIALKQEELNEQTKQIVDRLNELADSFSKSSQDSSYLLKQSSEIFTQLQSENSALKQELLYLAKQSENIYAGLAEKITEISDQAKMREDAMSALTDRVNEVSEQNLKSGEAYSNIIDQLTLLGEQNRRNEELFVNLTAKLDAISQQGYVEPIERPVGSETAEVDSVQLIDKLNYISEQLRRAEGAHTMLADKFEILSMRVEQFGFESAKGSSVYGAAPVYPTPVQAQATAEIDYDLLAQKVADIVSSREVISPDYIASKVAEQVVIPDVQSANLQVSVDTYDIARQVADLIDGKIVNGEGASVPVNANVNIDEETLADRIVQKISSIKTTEELTLNFDEETLADRIAQKISSIKTTEEVTLNLDADGLAEKIAEKMGAINATAIVPAASVSVNEEELADNIALKVGSLKAEDFEILVDDAGCTSISKEIAGKLDYEAISNKIAQNLREALDLASVVAPDYDEMAERISEKITVAGINEAAIADKAAAALSNYLPEIDTDDIADKVVGAVIDVLNAAPQPTIDSEFICNTITEKLINSQESHDYDIVLDEDGISKISEIVTEEIRTGTTARFDKVEEDIAKLSTLVNERAQLDAEQTASALSNYLPELVTEDITDKVVDAVMDIMNAMPQSTIDSDYICNTISERIINSQEESVHSSELNEDGISKICEVVTEEIRTGTGERFDKVEEDIAKLTELVSSVVVEEVYDEAEGEGEETVDGEEEYVEDYTALSEVVAAEIEKGITSKLAGIEENVAKLSEYITTVKPEVVNETVQEKADENKESDNKEYVEIDDTAILSEIVAAEIEKGITSKLAGIEENVVKVEESVAKLSEYITTAKPETSSETVQEKADDNKESDNKEYVEIDDTAILSEIVAAEIEKGITSKLAGIEENVIKVEESVAKLSTLEQNVAKLSTLEQNVAKITDYISSEKVKATDGQFEEVADYVTLSEVVASEIDRGISFRLDAVEENLIKLNELLENTVEASPEVIAAEIERGINSRLDAVEENLLRINDTAAEGGISTHPATDERTLQGYSNMYYDISSKLQQMYYENGGNFQKLNERFDKIDEDIAKVSTLAGGAGESVKDDRIAKVQDDVAVIKEMLANGAVVVSETAAAQPAAQLEEEEEEELVKVSDIVEPEEEEQESEPQPEPVAEPESEPQPEPVAEPEPQPEPVAEAAPAPVEQKVVVQSAVVTEEAEEESEEEDEGEEAKGFDIDVLDMDAFSDDELMPGEASEFNDGVDFENMMKYKRSFIARIIQSSDEYKQYYGEIKHALLSYKKVNSNVAWSSERFNKGRETIARLKIRGKTLCLYLALDPNSFKTSVYHHTDVSNNNSVEGTPMMVKVKSPLGVKKAIRLINEMLALRNGEKREIPERNYAAMYPYETIEDLIEEGLVKDVRKK